MHDIHPTAVISDEVTLSDDVTIGPNCTLTGQVTLGSGCRLVAAVHMQGPLMIGSGNIFYPGACIGFSPQHAKFDPETPGAGLIIGNDNLFREHVTVHRAYTKTPTSIGNDNYLMHHSHVGHDCAITDGCTLTGYTGLAGHVEVGEKVIFGGRSSAHQFTRVGRGAMIGGHSKLTQDVPPFCMTTSEGVIVNLNIVGMRRGGMSNEEIRNVRAIYRLIYRSGKSIASCVNELKARIGEPFVDEYLQFIESSTRGIAAGIGLRRNKRALKIDG
jgi:UDP-N-acetylglucosamine acyltransferase